MKKTLLALAIAGAYVGVAQAQSSVTLYGLVDTYLEAGKNGNTSVRKLSAGGLSGPRWGMRGSEDLGGGLSAVFTLEGGYNSDTGTLGQGGRVFGRQGFVGLSGGFGQLLVGRQYAPIFYTQADSDIDGYTTFSSPGELANYDGTTLRQDNQIRYVTPALGAFQAMVSYAPGEVPGNSSTGRIVGANLSAGLGPVKLVAGLNDVKVNSATVNNRKTYAIGASAGLGAVNLAANYWRLKTDNLATADTTYKGASIGASTKMGSFTLLGQLGQVKNQGNGKEKHWMIGTNYDLSKRTDWYTRFTQVKDSNNTSTADWFALGDVPTNGKNRTIALGIRHRF